MYGKFLTDRFKIYELDLKHKPDAYSKFFLLINCKARFKEVVDKKTGEIKRSKGEIYFPGGYLEILSEMSVTGSKKRDKAELYRIIEYFKEQKYIKGGPVKGERNSLKFEILEYRTSQMFANSNIHETTVASTL